MTLATCELIWLKHLLQELRFRNDEQLADIFTKSLRGPRIKYICDKLGAFDLYARA